MNKGISCRGDLESRLKKGSGQWAQKHTTFAPVGQNQHVLEIPTLTLFFIFHHRKKVAYIINLSLEKKL